jgi:hypothetical protein
MNWQHNNCLFDLLAELLAGRKQIPPASGLRIRLFVCGRDDYGVPPRTNISCSHRAQACAANKSIIGRHRRGAMASNHRDYEAASPTALRTSFPAVLWQVANRSSTCRRKAHSSHQDGVSSGFEGEKGDIPITA